MIFRVEFIDECPQRVAFFTSQSLRIDEMHQQRRPRSFTQALSHRLQPALDQVFASDDGRKNIRAAGTLTADTLFLLQSFQQFQHGRRLRCRTVRIQQIGQLTRRGRPPILQGLQNRQFRVGDVFRLSNHCQSITKK